MHICESCGHSIHGTETIENCVRCGGELCERTNCRQERDGEIYCTACSEASDSLVNLLVASALARSSRSDVANAAMDKFYHTLPTPTLN